MNATDIAAPAGEVAPDELGTGSSAGQRLRGLSAGQRVRGSSAGQRLRGLRGRLPLTSVRAPVSSRYLISRLVNAVIAVWGVLTIVFFSLHLTGNPAVLLVAPDAPKSDLARITAEMGFDRPLHEQYFAFLGNVLSGHFPESIRYGVDPLRVVFDRLPATLLLGGVGLGAGVLVGGAVGYHAVLGRSARLRRIPISILTALEAIPSFFLSVALIAIFAITFAVVPAGGNRSLSSLILPAMVLAAALAAPIARVFRTSLTETLGADHVRLARAKGLGRTAVLGRHVVLNALAPVVNVIGVQAGVVLGGAVITESVFSWPGLGQLMTSSIASRDYPVVLAAVTVMAISFVLINLAVDIVGAILDPRGGRR
ncbi:ABC transporter permease [Gordonia sp. ABSL1-1]|uniref:ABC transporter permease n=1 Tax=Gordonia sp. ABSL1-1 TaxID=3053923 RepID=UPI00257279E2|nr:ABC transporter permease [Gordonia sp. ABSL1-1]MDL9937286.1 ABC transporter permease [Gordonia sp. ABSL1-1]